MVNYSKTSHFQKGLEHETNPTPRYLGGAQLKYVPKYGIKGV